MFVRYGALFIVIKGLGFAWRRGKLSYSCKNQIVSWIRVFAWRHWCTPLHYWRAPPPKGCTPIMLKGSFSTHFLEFSRWFSKHIRHMRDLKLSSLRSGTMSIDRYKLGCLHSYFQHLIFLLCKVPTKNS